MTTSTEITDETRLTMLKHLAGGKSLDDVATITKHPRALVLDVVSKHGYPNSLDKGIAVLTAKLESGRRGEISTRVAPESPAVARSTPTPPIATPRPDDVQALIHGAKAHPSKKVQSQADRCLDAIARLRELLTEDERLHAARREAEEQRKAARAEIARLEAQLAVAKAKLRGSKPASTTIDVDGSVSAAELRAWAKRKGIDVPERGRIPADVREKYAAEQTAA